MSITANAGAYALLGPPTLSFTGVAGDPVLLQAVTFDEKMVDLTFSFAPLPSKALDPAQYQITPALTIASIRQISSTVYRLTTSAQIIGTTYTVTWPLH